jgi:hypothetical protein
VVVVTHVVVVSGSVVVLVADSDGSEFTSTVYEVPYHASGLPQHTPARRRYEPDGNSISIHESRLK